MFCPMVNIVILQDSQAGAFSSHKLLWSMERPFIIKNMSLGAFRGCLIVLCKKCVLDKYIVKSSS